MEILDLDHVDTIDRHVVLVLLRNSASLCKLVNIIRATPPSHSGFIWSMEASGYVTF